MRSKTEANRLYFNKARSTIERLLAINMPETYFGPAVRQAGGVNLTAAIVLGAINNVAYFVLSAV